MAVEPAGPFLEGLRQRGYYDLVGEYLNRMATSKLVSPDFQATIPYEQGLTLVQQSRLEPNAQAREKKINEATARFRSFLAEHKDHPLASQARSQLGNVIVERARLKVAEAGKPANAANKNELLGQARTRYEEAAATFQSLLDTLKATLSKPQWKTVPKEDVEKTEQLARMRQDYIQYQLVVATSWYWM